MYNKFSNLTICWGLLSKAGLDNGSTKISSNFATSFSSYNSITFGLNYGGYGYTYMTHNRLLTYNTSGFTYEIITSQAASDTNIHLFYIVIGT